MSISGERWIVRAFDVVSATLATIWPGSTAASDARRLDPFHLHRALTRITRLVKPYAGIAITLAGAFRPRAINYSVAA